jgi:hypothetical protein
MSFIGGCMAPQEDNGDVIFTFKGAQVGPAKASPATFHVRGRMIDGKFKPEGEVLGEGSFEVEGQAGWMELSSGKFYPFHAARSPTSPYVKGHMTQQGFVPSTREVH